MSVAYALRFVMRGGTEQRVYGVIRLKYAKDIYMTGTELTGEVIWDGNAGDILGFRLNLGTVTVHLGYAAYVKSERRNGRSVVKFISYGWSSLLGQNEPVPGMNYGVDLASLGALNVQIPNVTYESGTDTVNYIYVKEHSTVWDAVTAYGMKAYGRMPYIYGTNEVRVRAPQVVSRTYGEAEIVSEGEIADRRGMHSKVYMADADGQYTAYAVDQAAVDDGIVRERYYALDRQWLASPQMGLRLKLRQAHKRSRMHLLVKTGYSGEELYDKYVISGRSEPERIIGGIEVNIANGRTVCSLYEMKE